jgi:hypothetical protein
MIDRANEGNPQLPTGGMKATGEVRQSNSVVDGGNAKLEDQIKLLTETVLSLIKAFGQIAAGAPNPNAGYNDTRTEGSTTPPPPSYEQQMGDYSTKKAAYDAAQADKKAAADKEAEMKALATIDDSFDRMVRPHQAIDNGQLQAITKDVKGYTVQEREAAQYFLDHPEALGKLQKANSEFTGGSLEEITRADTIIRRGTAMAEFVKAKEKAAAAEGVPDPGPAPTRPPPASGSNPPPANNAPPARNPPPASVPSTDTPPNTGVGGTDRAKPSADTISGTPLERAIQRTAQMRTSVEEQTDALVKQMSELDPKDPNYKKNTEELDRKIKSLASVETMLMNMENMLQQTIDNIIKMRQEMAMNAIRHLS